MGSGQLNVYVCIRPSFKGNSEIFSGHRHCFRFLLGRLHVPGKIYKFWGVKEVYCGICLRMQAWSWK